MHILEPAQFARILPLVHTSGIHGHLTFVHAVIEGRQPGFITVDQAAAPRSAIAFNHSGFFLALGAPDADLLAATLAELHTHPVDLQSRELYAPTPAWRDLLIASLPNAARTARLGFAWQPAPGRPPEDWQSQIPPELALQPISEPLAAGIVDGTATQDFGIDPWFVRIAGGPRAYASLGLGLALVEKSSGTIASLCGVCALGGGEAEMEVGTTLAFRGRNLATLVSAAFMQQARAQGWTPAYTCASANLPSIHVARKLGYVEIEEVTGFQIA